jgi:hypothetical protein
VLDPDITPMSPADWNKAYRPSVFANLEFPEPPRFEDVPPEVLDSWATDFLASGTKMPKDDFFAYKFKYWRSAVTSTQVTTVIAAAAKAADAQELADATEAKALELRKMEAREERNRLDRMQVELFGRQPRAPQSNARATGIQLIGDDGEWHQSVRVGGELVVQTNTEEKLAAVRETFPLLNIAALVDPARPPRRWLLNGVVPEGEQVSIVAPGGTGKSLLLQALGVAAAQGDSEFLGCALSFPAGRKFLIVDMENSEDDLSERFISLSVTPANVAAVTDRLLILHLPQLAGLDTPTGAGQLMWILDAYGIGPGDVLGLDSMQRVTEGEEDKSDTLRRLYKYTSVELKRRGITTIRTDNTGKDVSRGARGTSGKHDDVGGEFILAPVGGDDERFTLSETKRRAKGSGSGIAFRRWTDDAGLLHFDRNNTTKLAVEATATRATRELLEGLGVDPDLGKNKAWELVQVERQRRADAGEPFPEGVSQKRVNEVQGARRDVRLKDADGDLSAVDYVGGQA